MKVIFVHICRWEDDLDSQADMHNKYKKFFSGRQVRPDWLEFWTVGPYSDLFRQYNQPCPYITSLKTIMRFAVKNYFYKIEIIVLTAEN